MLSTGPLSRGPVEVPDLVGLPVHIAIASAESLDLDVVDDKLDGPGIRSRTWPGTFWVTSQAPARGEIVPRGTRIAIEFLEDEGSSPG